MQDRQHMLLAELTVVNERLNGKNVVAVRNKVEFLRTRRRLWEQIYNYVMKGDADATLAAIEDANRKVWLWH